ncbi:hypothetical protein CEUSTIGMA_g8756.t1 [Chlamydomonas eustigma]|uniref:Ethanolaminephosphotransferase n=1 Tax=Chlamydomonas eustigma TaxID=1157962 RepID=A0A250XE20_9CHLO|nr:hypothetical protein CEUSTIGMA_g8756.t1 [Chlamydomonas eustigma]|eukprot:GAX81325.1 hypothetical protein CEUSTIGMA_g8756.t1 [Chlamydomonas eustigma]
MPYLSARALDGLKHYKYHSSGYTILDVIHTPFWNWFTSLLPMWLAPNVITLVGLLGVILSFLIDSWYLLDYQGEAPPWVYLFSALAVIIYVNLDCIDGKQARRTGSSSPLGQLFDHGCDALSVRLLLDNTHCSMNYPCSWTAASIIMLIMLPWILAHWEEYHTGLLQYGNGWFGVMEANYALALVHLSVYVFGIGMWERTLNDIVPFDLPISLSVRDLFFAAYVIGGLIQVLGQLSRVLAFDSSKLDKEERGNKELGFAARVKHLVIIVMVLVLGVWWTSDNEVAHGQCRMASISYGLIYALVASNLIVSHMAKEPVPVPYWAYALLFLGAVSRQFKVADSWTTTGVLMLIALLGYSHYVVNVINEICTHLGLQVFLIHPQKD